MDYQSRETVAITESIYYVSDNLAGWKRCSGDRIHSSKRFDSNSKSLKTSSPIKSIPSQQQISVCHNSAQQTNQFAWPMGPRLRNPNISYAALLPNTHKIHQSATKKQMTKNTSCKTLAKTFGEERQNSGIAVSLSKSRPIVKKSPIPNLTLKPYDSLFANTYQPRQKLPVNDGQFAKFTEQQNMKKTCIQSKCKDLLFSKIDGNSPSFSNILDEFKTQRSQQRDLTKQVNVNMGNFVETLHQDQRIDVPRHIIINEVREEQEDSYSQVCNRGCSPLNFRNELEAIYKGCFKISKT